jgi:hypothetical protein
MPEKNNADEWQLEEDDERIYAANITPETPKESYKRYVWDATWAAIDVSDTRQEVFRKVLGWNEKNDPKVPESSLVKMVRWALDHWDTKFGTSSIL